MIDTVSEDERWVDDWYHNYDKWSEDLPRDIGMDENWRAAAWNESAWQM